MSSLRERIHECHQCSLRPSLGQPVAGMGPANTAIMAVISQPDAEAELEQVPVAGRYRDLLASLLKEAGIQIAYLTCAVKCPGQTKPIHREMCRGWLWQEIQTTNPKVIIAFGDLPTRVLLQLSQKTRLSDIIGRLWRVEYMSAIVAPWYGLYQLFTSNQQLRRETTLFLRECLTCSIASDSQSPPG